MGKASLLICCALFILFATLTSGEENHPQRAGDEAAPLESAQPEPEVDPPQGEKDGEVPESHDPLEHDKHPEETEHAEEMENAEQRVQEDPDHPHDREHNEAGATGRAKKQRRGEMDDEHTIHFAELEPRMLQNRSHLVHDVDDNPHGFDPVEGINLPHLTFEDLFHAIDKDTDGKIDTDELSAWLKHITAISEAHSAAEQWNIVEKASQKLMSWDEFEAIFGKHLYESDPRPKDQVDHDRQQLEAHIRMMERRWQHCDRNHDGMMSFGEFIDFQHPQNKPYLSSLHFEEILEEIDIDKDGQASLNEFLINGHPPDSPLVEFLKDNNFDTSRFDENLVLFPNGSRVSEELFAEIKIFAKEFDTNGDWLLNRDEARVWIVPEHIVIPWEAEAQDLLRKLTPLRARDQLTSISMALFLANKEAFIESAATNYGEIIAKENASDKDAKKEESEHDEL
eukprot:scpid69932/ scgid7569/ Calumenin